MGDSDIRIFPSVAMVISAISPTNVSGVLTDFAVTSRLLSVNLGVINQPQSLTQFLTMPKGLYTLEYDIAIRSNFTTTVLSHVCTLEILYQGFSIALAASMLNTETKNMSGSRELLLTADGVLGFRFPVTNLVVTNAMNASLAINCLRRL